MHNNINNIIMHIMHSIVWIRASTWLQDFSYYLFFPINRSLSLNWEAPSQPPDSAPSWLQNLTF